MSKKLNLPLALGIFLIGLFSANVSQAQTSAYWDVNGLTNGQGGSATWSTSGTNWTTNSVNATANSGGPTGGGLFAVANGAAGAVATNSGNFTFNFGGTAGTVTQGGNYEAYGVNFLTTGYTWNIDGTGTNSRTITTTNGVSLGANALTLANGSRGLNSFTFAGPTAATAVGITATAGSTLTLRNLTADSATNSFGVYLSGGTISSNIAINVDIGAGSKLSLGSKSSGGATIDSAIALNTNASGVALNILNSTSGAVTFNGVISGANGLVLDNTGSGKIALNGANTYAGGTTVNSTGTGDVRYNTSSAFGSGTVSISAGSTSYLRATVNATDLANAVNIGTGATLQLATTNSAWKSTWSGVISGAGGINYGYSDAGLYLTGTNSSFGGGVNVSSTGSLYVSKLGNAGGNSSIGTNGAITISTTSVNQSTIRWTGTTNEVSDKSIVLSSTAGVILSANGATNSSLTLNGNITTTGSGARTLTFNGYDTNTLILNGVINENGGANSVVIGGNNSGTVVLANANNSFSGAITITNSQSGRTTILSTANIGNATALSTLGKNGTINFGSSSGGALTTLKYTGTGEISDKVINLASTVGGAILDQSGTGNLKFTSAIGATAVGAKTITLQGSTAGTGELGGDISDLGNVATLVKSGTGTWKLSGSNSYSGITEIKSAGVLQLGSTNSLSKNTSLLGASSGANTGTLDLTASGGGDYLANSYGTTSTGGFNMNFTNSSGSAATLRFTNANNYITIAANNSAGRSLINQSSLLDVRFDGNIEIGSTSNSVVELGGAGNFRVAGAIMNSGTATRGLQKTGAGTLTLAGTGNNYNGTTAVDGGTLLLTNNATLTGSTALTVSTAGTVSSSSSTRTAAATLNVASGSSLLSGSTTTVYSGGNLIMNGTAGSVIVETNGLVGGSGTFSGAVTLKSGSLLNPGNSPGTLRATSSSWAAGSTYNWEIDDAKGIAGTNWDLFSVTGALDLSALSSSAKMNLVLASLSTVTNFSATTPDSWVFAQAGSLVGAAFTAGANVTDLFNITATAFNGGVGPANGWRVEVGDTGRTLNLMAVPEPSTGSMLGLGLAGLVVTRLLRRKIS